MLEIATGIMCILLDSPPFLIQLESIAGTLQSRAERWTKMKEDVTAKTKVQYGNNQGRLTQLTTN